MQPKAIIDNYLKAQEAIHKAEEELAQKKKDILDHLHKSIQIDPFAIYTFRVKECRDDRVRAFQAEQECKCVVDEVDIAFSSKGESRIFVYPIVNKLLYTKGGKIKFKGDKAHTKRIRYNQWLRWELLDYNNRVVLSYDGEEVIIEGKYTEEQLVELRKRCLEIQKF
jgi:hypothetical protein